jgi:paraquat-inducible protein A
MTLLRHVLYPVFAVLAALVVIDSLEYSRLAAGAAAMQSLQGTTRLVWAAALEKLSLSWYSGARDLEQAYTGMIDAADAAATRALHWTVLVCGLAAVQLALAGRAPIRRAATLGWHLNLLASCAFVVGVIAPVLTVVAHADMPVLGDVVLRHTSKSVVSTVHELAVGGNVPLAAAVALFSLALPVLKMVLLVAVLAPVAGTMRGRALAILQAVGKWSMADVFVVALLIAVFALDKDAYSRAEVGLGLYFFLGYCILSMLATQCAVRALRA